MAHLDHHNKRMNEIRANQCRAAEESLFPSFPSDMVIRSSLLLVIGPGRATWLILVDSSRVCDQVNLG